MASSVLVRDEVLGTPGSVSFTLEFPTESITVRELIRERVYQEVQDHNLSRATKWRKLVEPGSDERTLNGDKTVPARIVDWRPVFDRACDAYAKRRVLVLVGDRQTQSLDDVVTLTRGVEVTFLRLVMLVGG